MLYGCIDSTIQGGIVKPMQVQQLEMIQSLGQLPQHELESTKEFLTVLPPINVATGNKCSVND